MKAEEARRITKMAIIDKKYMSEIYKNIKKTAEAGVYCLSEKVRGNTAKNLIKERLENQNYSVREVIFPTFPSMYAAATPDCFLLISWGDELKDNLCQQK